MPVTFPILSKDDLDRMTEAERALYEEGLKYYSQTITPLKYMQAVSPKSVDYLHIQILEEHVLALIEHRLYPSGLGPQAIKVEADVWVHPETGEETCQFLAITMPPRHGKSYYVSDHLPAWYLTNYPDNDVILTTHEADFSESWSDKARNHIKEHPEFGITIDPKNDRRSEWLIKGRKGGLHCAGAGGSINGKPADLLIGDDLVKNSAQAYSKVERNNLWNWYLTTWKLRREPDGVGIAMFTRWHEDDMIGRALINEPNSWFLLNLPALAFEEVDDEGVSIDPDTKERDLLGRTPGQPLCPERYSARALLRIKSGADVADEGVQGGETVFAAMFQGKPSIEGGGIIHRPFYYYALAKGVYRLFTAEGETKLIREADCWRFATLDLAATTKERSDFSVFSVWDAAKSGELMWRGMHQIKIESSDHVQWVADCYAQYSEPRIKLVGIEKVTYGLTLWQKLRKIGRKIFVFPLKPDKDKISRAIPFGLAISEGKVFFPRDADWIKTAEEELTKFPNAPHDDIVDTGSYAMEMWMMAPKRPPKKKQDDSPEGRAHRLINAHKPKKKSPFGGLLGQ